MKPPRFRKPTQAETNQTLLDIADRLERIANRFNKRAVLDDHAKNGHVAYLQTEAQNIRSAAKREKRFITK
jgi:hypothetical protein